MRKKIFYKNSLTDVEEVKYYLMKEMLNSIIREYEFETFPAIRENQFGIFCITEVGGKKFFEFEELTKLFARKNNEVKRLLGFEKKIRKIATKI